MGVVTGSAKETYITSMKELIDSAYNKWDEVVLENPTNIGKEELVEHLVNKHGKTLFISQSYDINRQWNEHPGIVENVVFVTYTMFSSIDSAEIHDFCRPYSLIILDEAHHAGAKGYYQNISLVLNAAGDTYKVFGMTTHTKRYSDNAEDVAYTVFGGHKIDGISFENAIKERLLPQFDYISALYSLPKDIDELVASSSLAKKIISDSKLVQVNEEGIKEIIRKHMPDGNRKVVYFVPTIEDSEDAEKMARELGYGDVYAINYTMSDKENRESLIAYNNAKVASLVCISKFNEGAIPKGTNTVVVLRRTSTINIFERQVLTALASETEKPVVYDFVSNIDNLIYSKTENDDQTRGFYAERVKSLCSQSIVIDYARQWSSVFNKLRSLNPGGWTDVQDDALRRLYPKYGNDIYKYIKGHNLKDCILRAEMLGIKYIPPKQEETKKEEVVRPYTILIEELLNDPEIKDAPRKSLGRLQKVYMQTLDTGSTGSDISKAFKIGEDGKKTLLFEMINALIRATKITEEEKSHEIAKRQQLFRANIESYVRTHKKKSSNIVVLDGKALTKEESSKKELDKRLAEKEFERKKDRMVLVEGNYMDKKSAIAGLYGDTIAEHILYKLYWRFLTDTYKTFQKSVLMKEFSPEDVVEKINNLRNSRNFWTEEDIKDIEAFEKKNNTYPRLIRAHSDLDILEKAIEMKNNNMANYCRSKTANFERNFKAFIAEYEEAFDAKHFEEKRKLEEQRIAEENHKKNVAEKERLKKLKPTVMVISKNRKK